ncbi:MAG: hypothetical protein KA144_05580 [Xanthomonadaceae bacterium]|nr:hypothetical protein [Xanthomonadaceae bacterium]
MACRLHNAYDKTLDVDLRGGEVLRIRPNTTSRAIVEEALYDNHHLADWERRGWIKRVPARMRDVIAEANSAPQEAPARASAKNGAKQKAKKKVGRAADASRSTKKAGKASATASKTKSS